MRILRRLHAGAEGLLPGDPNAFVDFSKASTFCFFQQLDFAYEPACSAPARAGVPREELPAMPFRSSNVDRQVLSLKWKGLALSGIP